MSTAQALQQIDRTLRLLATLTRLEAENTTLRQQLTKAKG